MKSMPNLDIRAAMLGYKNYEVARCVGITEFTLCRWLRYDLTAERKAKILLALKKLSERGENDGACK